MVTCIYSWSYVTDSQKVKIFLPLRFSTKKYFLYGLQRILMWEVSGHHENLFSLVAGMLVDVYYFLIIIFWVESTYSMNGISANT